MMKAAETWLSCFTYVQIFPKILLETQACAGYSCNTAFRKLDLTVTELRKCSYSEAIWLLDKSENLVSNFSGEHFASNSSKTPHIQMVLFDVLQFSNRSYFRQHVKC